MEFENLLSTNQFKPPMLLRWAETYNERWIAYSEELTLLAHDKATHNSDREHSIYRAEQAAIEERKSDKDTIKQLGKTVEYLHNKLKGDNGSS